MNKKIFEIVKGVIFETLQVDTEGVSLEDKIEDICQDSIQIFSLVMNFEKKFNYRINYGDLIKIETVGDIVDLVVQLEEKGEISSEETNFKG
ncbi:MAG: phosphopantetheine-binding protein [Candidatus Moraniibacteriota bacterium]